MLLAVVFSFAFLFQLFGLRDAPAATAPAPPSASSPASSSSMVSFGSAATVPTAIVNSKLVAVSATASSSPVQHHVGRALLSVDSSTDDELTLTMPAAPTVTSDVKVSSGSGSNTGSGLGAGAVDDAAALSLALQTLLLRPDVAFDRLRASARHEAAVIDSLAAAPHAHASRALALLGALTNAAAASAAGGSATAATKATTTTTKLATAGRASGQGSVTAGATALALSTLESGGDLGGLSRDSGLMRSSHAREHAPFDDAFFASGFGTGDSAAAAARWSEFAVQLSQRQTQRWWLPLLQRALLHAPSPAGGRQFPCDEGTESTASGTKNATRGAIFNATRNAAAATAPASSSASNASVASEQRCGAHDSASSAAALSSHFIFCPHAVNFQLDFGSARGVDGVSVDSVETATAVALSQPHSAAAASDTRLPASIAKSSKMQSPSPLMRRLATHVATDSAGDGSRRHTGAAAAAAVPHGAGVLRLLLPTRSVQSALAAGAAAATSSAGSSAFEANGSATASSSAHVGGSKTGNASSSTTTSSTSSTDGRASPSGAFYSVGIDSVSEVTCQITNVREIVLA